jgi:hypothetical protein
MSIPLLTCSYLCQLHIQITSPNIKASLSLPCVARSHLWQWVFLCLRTHVVASCIYRSLLQTLRLLYLCHVLLDHTSDNEYSSAYVLMSLPAVYHLTTNSWPLSHDNLLLTAVTFFLCYFMMPFPVVLMLHAYPLLQGCVFHAVA